MSQYSETEIARIVNDCENLTQPDGTFNDEGGYTSEASELSNRDICLPKNYYYSRHFSGEPAIASQETSDDEDFEKIFQASKLKKQIVNIPGPIDFSAFQQSNADQNNADILINVNKELKSRLNIFKKKLDSLLKVVLNRHKSNVILLGNTKEKDLKDGLSLKNSYIRCGMPFFKDAFGYPAPENEDYKARKKLNEFFPFDHPCDLNNDWKMKEKVALLKGVKNQMVEFIKSQQSQKVCQESKTRNKIQKLRFIYSNQDLNQMSMLDIYETIKNHHPTFSINWNIISFNDLHSNHSVTECMGMWYSYLRPDINREPFTDEENAILAHVVVMHNYQNWEAIASQLDRRTSLQTFVYFYSSTTRLCPPNVRWTPDEDAKLFEAVKQHTVSGQIMWSKVGYALDCRNREQCYNRYIILTRYNSAKKGVFSNAENRILLQYVSDYGTDFRKMPKNLLPNRSLVQIKNHYNVALKHKGKVNPWVYDEDVQLMDFVEKEGPNWSKLADILQTHNRLSCRTRYLTISKFLKNNPTKTIADVPSRLKTVTAVHKAVLQDEEELNDEEGENNGFVRTKTFGMLTFEDFQEKNPELYCVLKTTYNFDIMNDDVNIYNQKFLILKSLLNVDESVLKRKPNVLKCVFTNKQLNAIKNALNENIEVKFVKEIDLIKTHTQFLLPPNFNTAIGLRAVIIKMIEEPITENNIVKQKPNKTHSEKFKKELEKFQKMFFSLFYWTAMTAKMDANELREIYLIKRPKTSTFDFINRFQLKSSPVRFFQPAALSVKAIQASKCETNEPILKMYIDPSQTNSKVLRFDASEANSIVNQTSPTKKFIKSEIKSSSKKKAINITNCPTLKSKQNALESAPPKKKFKKSE